MTICANCNHEYSYKYCNKCGQSHAMNGRLHAADLAKDIFHSFFHTGNGLFFTFEKLVMNPGRVLRGYLDGRRKVFFSPVKLFLICTLIYLTTLHAIADPLHTKSIFRHFIDNYKYSMVFAFVVITASMNWLVFRKAKLNFTEHFVIAMYIRSILLFAESIFMLASELFSVQLVWISIAISLIYYVYAFAAFFRRTSTFGSIISNTIVYIVSQLLFITPFILYNTK